MIKTRLFQHGRINYRIQYTQFPMDVIDEITGDKKVELMHREEVDYFEFPFTFGREVQFGPCKDPHEYENQ